MDLDPSTEPPLHNAPPTPTASPPHTIKSDARMSVDSVTEDQTNKVKFASNVSLSLHDGQQDHEHTGEKEAVSAADCHPPSPSYQLLDCDCFLFQVCGWATDWG